LERGSHLATIAAALIAVAAVLVATCDFRETQRFERETLDMIQEGRAVDLFVKYNDLMQHEPARRAQRDSWRGNLSIALAESIWRLRRADSGWVETVAWMLQTENSIKAVTDLDCSTYDPGFVTLAKERLQHDVCAH